MAQGALDGDDIASCCNQSGSKVVPKVMEPDPADTGLLERPTPAVANRVLMWRIVPIAAEDPRRGFGLYAIAGDVAGSLWKVV